MTDPLHSANLSVATPAQPRVGPYHLPSRSHQSPYEPVIANEEEEEDDSTIKCVCGFKHDDGSSVFCESCKTWQHTECYYWIPELGRPKSKEELERITHLCMDCHQRPLDIQAAITRQKTKLSGLDQDERKARKAPPKSHKKKSKAGETNGVTTNGWSLDLDNAGDRANKALRDHSSTAKKHKSSHKSSQSVGTSTLPQGTAYVSHKRSASTAQSPVKTTHRSTSSRLYKENFSETFMQLFDNDPGEQTLNTNLHSNINFTDDLSNWAKDCEALREATRIFSHQDVFHKLDQPLEKLLGTPPQKQFREDPRVWVNGRHPRWKYLTSNGPTKRDTIIGELKGAIGHMRDYIKDHNNRWDELRHPVPFVFFHPKLPIYIDTRESGTICRYLRRSCRPNLHMKTFLENGSDYRFCFTAKEDIDSGAELTIGWTPDEHMRKFVSNKIDMTHDLSPGGEDYVAGWVSKVSAEFGGCACGQPESCWIVRYDSEFMAPTNRKTTQSRRKAQTDSHDSSDAEDGRSSSRSNSESRGITPNGPYSNSAAQGLDISERDKRKIAALEKSWENDKHQPATKKKKRNSGSSTHPPGQPSARSLTPHAKDEATGLNHHQRPPNTNVSSVSLPNTPSLPSKPQYVDVSTSGRKPGSPTSKPPNGFGRIQGNGKPIIKSSWSNPNTPTIPSPLRSTYVSIAVQTEPDAEGDLFQTGQTPRSDKKPFMSMTRRLLLQSQRDRQRLVERQKSTATGIIEGPNGSPTAHYPSTPMSYHTEQDITTTDKTHSPETLDSKPDGKGDPAAISVTEQSKAPPWPPKDQIPSTNGASGIIKPPSSPTTVSPSLTASPQTSPISTNPPVSHPIPHAATRQLSAPSTSSNVQPSPVKKTINLQEYMKRKASSSAESRTASTTGISSPDMVHQALKPALGIAHAQSEPILESENAIVETPNKEEGDPMDTIMEEAGAKETSGPRQEAGAGES